VNAGILVGRRLITHGAKAGGTILFQEPRNERHKVNPSAPRADMSSARQVFTILQSYDRLCSNIGHSNCQDP
jgi:hypothetical protein